MNKNSNELKEGNNMVKTTVCDICKKNGKLVETTHYRKVKNRPDLRLDVCTGCNETIDFKKMPIDEYQKLVYSCHNWSIE